MRPLIVLLVLAGALVGLFMFLNQDPDSPGGGVGPEGGSAASGGGPKVTLEGPDDGERIEPEGVRFVPPIPEPPEGDHTNVLYGAVINEGGAPVPAARVVLTRWGRNTFAFADEVDHSKDIKTMTDAQGNFAFENVEPYEQYSLVVTHEEYAPTDVGQVAVGESGDFPHHPITLAPGMKLWGQVRDEGQNAVPNAKVTLSSMDLGLGNAKSADAIERTTDDQGNYEFAHVGKGNYVVEVEADGYGKVKMRQIFMSGRSGLQRDILLEVAHMISGRVVAAGEAPVADAIVQAYSTTNRGKQTQSQVKTDAKGQFTFDDVSQGTYTVLVNATGFKPERVQRVETGELDVVVELRKLPTIQGTVVDASTNKPVRKFSVRLRQEVANMNQSVPISNDVYPVVDAKGAFSIPCPKAGTYIVEALSDQHPGCFSEPVEVGEEQTLTGVLVRMTPGGTIRGRLVDTEGRPIPRGLVSSHDNEWSDDPFMAAIGNMWPTVATTREVRANADGVFVLENLAPTQYQINVKHGSFSSAKRKEIVVTEGAENDIGDVKLTKGGEVVGTVYDPSGAVLPGAVVQLNSEAGAFDSARSYSTKTGSDGRYSIPRVQPGSYNIKAIRTATAQRNPFDDMIDIKRTQVSITVFDGQKVNQDFNLARLPEPEKPKVPPGKLRGADNKRNSRGQMTPSEADAAKEKARRAEEAGRDGGRGGGRGGRR